VTFSVLEGAAQLPPLWAALRRRGAVAAVIDLQTEGPSAARRVPWPTRLCAADRHDVDALQAQTP
jgi:hypothetical protein